MNFSMRNFFGKSSNTEQRGAPTIKIDYGTGTSDDDVSTITDPLTISAVITCTERRASTISTLPLMIYKKTDSGVNLPVPEHPLSKLFADSPYKGKEMSTVDWLHYQMLNYDLNGNAYAQIVRNNGGQIVELIPIPADKVSVGRGVNGQLIYKVSGLIDGQIATKNMSVDDVLHIKNYSTDGIVGQSVISMAKETVFGAASEMNASSRRVAKNTLKVTNILTTTAASMAPEHQKALQESLRKSKDTIILTNGLAFSDRKVTISPEDAQFLQSYSFKQSEIAALFGIPAYMLNITSDRKPAASVEAETLGFLRDCIRGIMRRWEAALNLRLLSDEEKKVYTFAFDETELLRLDSNALMNFASRGIATGLFTVNEMRALAGYPPVEGGDVLRTPLNMGPVDNNNQNQTP